MPGFFTHSLDAKDEKNSGLFLGEASIALRLLRFPSCFRLGLTASRCALLKQLTSRCVCNMLNMLNMLNLLPCLLVLLILGFRCQI